MFTILFKGLPRLRRWIQVYYNRSLFTTLFKGILRLRRRIQVYYNRSMFTILFKGLPRLRRWIQVYYNRSLFTTLFKGILRLRRRIQVYYNRSMFITLFMPKTTPLINCSVKDSVTLFCHNFEFTIVLYRVLFLTLNYRKCETELFIQHCIKIATFLQPKFLTIMILFSMFRVLQ